MAYGEGGLTYHIGVFFGALIKDTIIGEWIRGSKEAVFSDIAAAKANKELLESYRVRHNAHCKHIEAQNRLIETQKKLIKAYQRDELKMPDAIFDVTLPEYLKRSVAGSGWHVRKLTADDFAEYASVN